MMAQWIPPRLVRLAFLFQYGVVMLTSFTNFIPQIPYVD
jgi:hypothetical protein